MHRQRLQLLRKWRTLIDSKTALTAAVVVAVAVKGFEDFEIAILVSNLINSAFN